MVIEKIRIEGWKGKDIVEITGRIDGTYLIEEHRKNKETKETNIQQTVVEGEAVRNLHNIIRYNSTIGETLSAKYLWRKIIEYYLIKDKDNRPLSIDAFSGGSNRAKHYFPKYYYPMKVLEAKKYVIYYGRGGVCRQK